MNDSSTRATKILTAAIDKTDQVQDDLVRVAETLGDANAVLSGPLSTVQAVAAVAGAIENNVATEAVVQDAAKELESVKALIEEAQVVQAQAKVQGQSGAGTASILAYFEGRRAQADEDDERQKNA